MSKMTKYMEAGIETFGENVFGKGKYYTNVEYYHYKNGNKECLGEIDIMGYLDDTLVLVEYKRRDTREGRRKAKGQLLRHKKFVVPTNQKYCLVYADQDLHFEVLEEGVRDVGKYKDVVK